MLCHKGALQGTALSDRRGRKESREDLLPDDCRAQAGDIGYEHFEQAKLSSGAVMLSEVPKMHFRLNPALTSNPLPWLVTDI